MEQSDGAFRIVGGRGPMTGSGKIGLAVAVVVLLCVVSWAAYRRDWAFFVFLGIMLTGNVGLQFVLCRTVVTGDGIRRPLRRRDWVSWSDVESVASADPGFPWVRVNLRDQKTLSLSGIPASKTEAVAGLGQKEIRTPPLSVRPASGEHVGTDQQVAADVARRAQALADERAAMDGFLLPPRPYRGDPAEGQDGRR